MPAKLHLRSGRRASERAKTGGLPSWLVGQAWRPVVSSFENILAPSAQIGATKGSQSAALLWLPCGRHESGCNYVCSTSGLTQQLVYNCYVFIIVAANEWRANQQALNLRNALGHFTFASHRSSAALQASNLEYRNARDTFGCPVGRVHSIRLLCFAHFPPLATTRPPPFNPIRPKPIGSDTIPARLPLGSIQSHSILLVSSQFVSVPSLQLVCSLSLSVLPPTCWATC